MSSGEHMTDHTAGQREPSAPSRGSVANHDAVPAAIARTDADRNRTDKAALRPGEGTGNTPVFDRSKPINAARLAALEELSALDQKLELEYGLTGNPLIKAQQRMAAKQDTNEPRTGAVRGPDPDSRVWETQGHTPPQHTTPAECSTPREGTSEPVAWLVTGNAGSEYEYVTLFRDSADAAASEEGGTVAPLYRSPTLTDAEREAVEAAIECCEDITYGSENEPEAAATLRGLLERLK